MKRNRLSIRAVTFIGQQLPKDWNEKLENFKVFINEKKTDINIQDIGNIDEVPMTFNMPGNFTVDQKGAEDNRITTTVLEKCNFTVILCVTADGGKLSLMVIFKRKTKEKFPKGIIVKANDKGWMNQEMMQNWLKEAWNKRKNVFFKPKSLLIYDSATPHLTPEVKN